VLQNFGIPTISVLLIDGNDKDRAILAAQLRNCSRDYQILEATDGEAGLLLFRARQIDCVVLALELPDQSGYKVLVDLVSIASRPNVAVVALTNRLQRGLRQLARQKGPTPVLSNNSCRVSIWIELSSALLRLWGECPRKIGTALSNSLTHRPPGFEHLGIREPLKFFALSRNKLSGILSLCT
jgi:CheY-like chemotaxis protein